MAPPQQYDSESSGEGEDYTETNVLLGYASKDAGDDNISRLGGRPDWLDTDKSPSAALARCKICKDLMVLLLQLNAELPTQFPGHERRLYVFSCKRKSCRRREGSTSVVRGLRIEPGAKAVSLDKKEENKSKAVEEKTNAQKPQSNLGETLFGSKGLGTSSGNANPFATGLSSGGGSSNPFASNPFSSTPKPAPEPAAPKKTDETTHDAAKPSADEEAKSLPKTFAQTLSLNNPQDPSSNPPPAPEPWPTEAEQPAPYPVSYLSEAEYETLDPTPQTIPQATRMEVDDPASAGGSGKEDKEVFESTMDFDFQKFADRLAQNPEQSIRYEFAGQPLLYSKTDAVGKALSGSGMPRCGNCGARRVFEVQLCPHAITELESEEMSLDGMDWGTIVVGVCERDCQARGVQEGEAGYLQEWAGVQWEELTAQRR
ncbi:PDCD2_C domain-containing protein [Microdochium trichocladiopsis]|uniref:PDCD2_C domain-containing protein n=1 Tax=Microdochium trichocladiopsis TaxID=1682393 RepID=A0A9P9BST5_9PEZI|nr:PDCD2_C domain-containing protein [Microdochium trichocladiopsis]KAH7029156.1 PDCD2_C domain-containing protein [Microdochium trichocladiopsis]